MSVWSNAFNQEAGAMNTPGFSDLPFRLQQPMLLSGYRGNPSGLEMAAQMDSGAFARPGATSAPPLLRSPRPQRQTAGVSGGSPLADAIQANVAPAQQLGGSSGWQELANLPVAMGGRRLNQDELRQRHPYLAMQLLGNA